MSVEVVSKTVVRSATVAMAEPVGIEWDEFWPLMNATWDTATRFANNVMAYYYTQDLGHVKKLGDNPKLKELKRDGYAACYRRLRPLLTASSASCIEGMVWKRYLMKDATGRTVRWNAITGMASVPSFRYAMPYPVHNRDWAVEKSGDDLILKFRLPVRHKPDADYSKLRVHCLETTEVAVRLRNGHEYQLQMFKAIADGTQKQRELKIILRQKTDTSPAMVMFSTAVTASAKERNRSGELTVKLGDNPKVLVTHGQRIWKWHGDHVSRAIARHQATNHRLADDTKFEPRQNREEIRGHRKEICDRHNRWLDAQVKKLAAWLVGYADRRGAAMMKYDDKDKSGFVTFPWAALKTSIEMQCANAGLEFVPCS